MLYFCRYARKCSDTVQCGVRFKIANALTDRFKNRNTTQLFTSLLDQLSEFERNKGEKYWQRMINEGGIDRFNHQEKGAKKEAENYIDINTVKHTEFREVGGELNNSAASELCSDEVGWTPGLNALYKVTDDLYSIKTETTNCQLKTDLNLRPIFHQTDDRSDAHLFFGLLSYWVVNTIRYQLKQNDIRCYWTEITKRMSTQKLVTTEALNALGDKVELRQCSCPSKQAIEIYDALGLKHHPFKKRKICRTLHPPNQPQTCCTTIKT